ncbi:hypothetical protein AB0C34_01620 [Nocardia sp. NPDC049220]|uniref:hypothetical protein n=1 Tax=Nocardia sp. NPDC049220 TaxID=3155273 RepID=UPI0033F46591
MIQRVTDMNLRGVSRPPISTRQARANIAQAAGGFADDFDGLFLDKDVPGSFDIDDNCGPVRSSLADTEEGRALIAKHARMMALVEAEMEQARRHNRFTIRGIGEEQCREQTANAIARRGTDKAKRLADALRVGAVEVRGGRKRTYAPVKMKDGN